jgi:hypothetical protein
MAGSLKHHRALIAGAAVRSIRGGLKADPPSLPGLTGNPSSLKDAFAKMDAYAGLRLAEGLRPRRRVKPAYDEFSGAPLKKRRTASGTPAAKERDRSSGV